jgi:hypothetical protein
MLVTANVHGSLIIVALMMEAILSSETSVCTRAIQHHVPEYDLLLHSHRRESPKSCIFCLFLHV